MDAQCFLFPFHPKIPGFVIAGYTFEKPARVKLVCSLFPITLIIIHCHVIASERV